MQRIRMGISYSPQLAWYLLNSDLSRAQFGFLSNSTTGLANLNGTIIGEIVVPVPPPAEQATIVAFLDRETGKIDALVEEQRRLIELLKEKRQAVISHAVTKGLDPSAPMKDSGVEWLGEVPAHWEVRRLKQISISFCDGPFGSGLKSEHYVDDGVRVIRLQNIRNGTFAGEDTAFISKEYFQRELARHDVQGNDVLVAGLGDDRNAVGRACVAPPNVPPAMVKADCFRFRLRSESSPDFVAHQLSAGAVFAAGTLSLGSTRSRIPLSVMAGRVVAIPGIDEQVRIAREVAKRIAGFESLIGEAEKGIALLQERRAALISAAVTGKIDVRGWTDADVRKAVAAEIIYLNARNPTFGRVKNQKLIYLAEAHAGIHEIGGRYEREAAGPFDGALMALVERELERAGVVTVRQGVRGTAVDYALTPGWKPDRERLKAMLGDRLVAFDHVNEKLADLDTRGAEAVATLYAVWNDALIDGEAYDDTRVIRGFLDEWHPEKREKFSEAKLREWLGWMRRNGLTPQGRGPKTAAESLFK
jgi:type I restriction enzyme S subunit